MEFSNLCRCCMQPGSISIFDSNVENLKLVEIIEKYTGQTIFPYDNLPKSICLKCLDKFDTWHAYVVRCSEVWKLFSKIFNSQIKVEKQDDPPTVEQITSTLDIKHENEDIGNYNSRMFENISVKEEIIDDDENTLPEEIKNYNKKCDSILQVSSETGCSSSRSIEQVENDLSSQKKFDCEFCDIKFSSIENVQRHKRIHTGELRGFCKICNKGFRRKDSLKVHMLTHSLDTPYVCQVCGQGFKWHRLLQNHLMTDHHSLEVQCKICQESVMNISMGIHMRVVHGKRLEYSCNMCDKTFTVRRLLETHMNGHTKKHKCKVCTKSFVHFGYLKLHMRVEHGNRVDFLCKICGKTLKTKLSLELHTSRHSKGGEYKCKICFKTFNHPKILKTHMESHSDEKPYSCNVCGKGFRVRCHLSYHMRIHSEAKPHSCKICKKSFTTAVYLRIHERLHTGETPFRCSVCNKGYIDSSSRRKHEIRVHKNNKSC